MLLRRSLPVAPTAERASPLSLVQTMTHMEYPSADECARTPLEDNGRVRLHTVGACYRQSRYRVGPLTRRRSKLKAVWRPPEPRDFVRRRHPPEPNRSSG